MESTLTQSGNVSKQAAPRLRNKALQEPLYQMSLLTKVAHDPCGVMVLIAEEAWPRYEKGSTYLQALFLRASECGIPILLFFLSFHPARCLVVRRLPTAGEKAGWTGATQHTNMPTVAKQHYRPSRGEARSPALMYLTYPAIENDELPSGASRGSDAVGQDTDSPPALRSYRSRPIQIWRRLFCEESGGGICPSTRGAPPTRYRSL